MTRRGFIKGLLAVALVGLFSAAYGFFIEPALRLRVRRWQLKRADWTAAPLRIAVLADLHVGEPHVGLDRIRQVVRRTNALSPDLVLLLGDFAAGHKMVSQPVKIADLAPVLAGLQAQHGVFAVLGNHDWWDDLSAQRRGGWAEPVCGGFAQQRHPGPVERSHQTGRTKYLVGRSGRSTGDFTRPWAISGP